MILSIGLVINFSLGSVCWINPIVEITSCFVFQATRSLCSACISLFRLCRFVSCVCFCDCHGHAIKDSLRTYTFLYPVVSGSIRVRFRSGYIVSRWCMCVNGCSWIIVNVVITESSEFKGGPRRIHLCSTFRSYKFLWLASLFWGNDSLNNPLMPYTEIICRDFIPLKSYSFSCRESFLGWILRECSFDNPCKNKAEFFWEWWRTTRCAYCHKLSVERIQEVTASPRGSPRMSPLGNLEKSDAENQIDWRLTYIKVYAGQIYDDRQMNRYLTAADVC